MVGGLALLVGRFVPLAVVVIFPSVVNMLLLPVFLDPAGLPMAIQLMAGLFFLADDCRGHCRPLFAMKIHSKS